MKLPRFTPQAKKAIRIGTMCSLSYLAVYVAKNILSAASPQMIESGAFTTENIGALSSVYYFSYAAAISSTLFANAVSDIGWGNLILVWFGLMVCGILVALPYRKKQPV